jgi:hypothetical protein
MPVCPPKSPKERESDRWENVVGKALKDWITSVMKRDKLTRAEARVKVLLQIKQLATVDSDIVEEPGKDWMCSQPGLRVAAQRTRGYKTAK